MEQIKRLPVMVLGRGSTPRTGAKGSRCERGSCLVFNLKLVRQ